MRSLLFTLAAVALAISGAYGCGGDDPAVVRIGERVIGAATVSHWTRIIGSSGAFQGFGGEGGAPRQRAIRLLILATWVNAEAAREHVSPQAREVRDAVKEREEANGKAEFESALRGAGEMRADVELEVRTNLAADAIRHKLASQASPVSQAEIARFYKDNLRKLFFEPQERDTELIEGLRSPAAATALVRRIGTGPAFTKRALKEAVVRSPAKGSNPPDIESVIDAIFAARPGLPSRPMSLNNHWTVFVVRKVRPARPEPLSKVHGEVVERLIALHRREKRTAFEREYRMRWTARTSCGRGYVVPGCAQHGAPQAGSLFPSE